MCVQQNDDKFMVENTHFMCIIKGEVSMKQRDLIMKLESIGFQFDRHGGNHDVYRRGTDKEMIPRHKEINEHLAKAILLKWGLEVRK